MTAPARAVVVGSLDQHEPEEITRAVAGEPRSRVPLPSEAAVAANLTLLWRRVLAGERCEFEDPGGTRKMCHLRALTAGVPRP